MTATLERRPDQADVSAPGVHRRPSSGSWWRVLAWRGLFTLATVFVVGLGVVVVRAASMQPSSLPPQAMAGPAPGGVAAPVPAASPAGASSGPAGRIDQKWLASASAATGIPPRALAAYAAAALAIAAEQPQCGLSWNTVAAIGHIESQHGRYGGSVLRADGHPDPSIRGVALDGSEGFASISDSDGGRWDGDTVWDRAVGPMQFIPSTWDRWGADGNGDGVADPNQIDDAALAAARYLCHSGAVTSTSDWRAAILSYNRSEVYVDDVAGVANEYATAVGSRS